MKYVVLGTAAAMSLVACGSNNTTAAAPGADNAAPAITVAPTANAIQSPSPTPVRTTVSTPDAITLSCVTVDHEDLGTSSGDSYTKGTLEGVHVDPTTANSLCTSGATSTSKVVSSVPSNAVHGCTISGTLDQWQAAATKLSSQGMTSDPTFYNKLRAAGATGDTEFVIDLYSAPASLNSIACQYIGGALAAAGLHFHNG